MSTSIVSLLAPTTCARCKAFLFIPEWSETVNTNETIQIWHCPICGHEFETVGTNASQAMSDDEVIEDFFPNLLVA